jgi:peptide-methionine (R)-S-oxide reductase
MDELNLKKKLTEMEYKVTQEKATEAAFSGEYYNHKEDGVYTCKVCDVPLFSSERKFDSGSGWPSFDKPMDGDNIKLVVDNTHGMTRTEAVCKNCGAHLGHVFSDGPKDTTGQRFCINSCSLDFKKDERS